MHVDVEGSVGDVCDPWVNRRRHAACEMQSADAAVNEETRAEREQKTGAERERELPTSSSVGARICEVLALSEVRSDTVYPDDDCR